MPKRRSARKVYRFKKRSIRSRKRSGSKKPKKRSRIYKSIKTHKLQMVSNPRTYNTPKFTDFIPVVSKPIGQKIFSRIIGPVTLYKLYSQKYKSTIYLFGDIHEEKTTCKVLPGTTMIGDFIIAQADQNQDKIIDIFLELPYAPKSSFEARIGNITDNYIFATGEQLRSCLRVSKSGCKWPNMRVHYSDIRHKPGYINSIYSLFWAATCLSRNNWEDAEKSFKGAKMLSEEVIFQVDKIMREAKIYKQFENSYLDHKDKEQILNSIARTFSLIKLGKKQYDIIEYYVKNKIHIDQSSSIYQEIIKFTSNIMDAYTIGRIFRNFKDAPPVKNVIVYAGNDHIRTYVYWLKLIEFERINRVVSNTENIDYQCIDISSFKQPFFQ